MVLCIPYDHNRYNYSATNLILPNLSSGVRDKEAGDKKSVVTTKVNLGPPRTNLDSDKQYFCDKSQNVPLKPNKTNYVCQNCSIICVNNTSSSKPSIKRSVSYQQRGKNKKEYKKNGLQRRRD